MIKNFIEKNDIKYEKDISLKKYNTYRIDVLCEYLVFPDSIYKVQILVKYLIKNNIKYMFLGNGSNVIFNCEKYEGVIIKLDALNKITIKNNVVVAEAGCHLLKLSLAAIDAGLTGLEFANAIPGLVGASTAMNAGAYNESMADVVKKVKVLDDDLNVIELTNKELNFEYRTSLIKENKKYVVLEVTFELKEDSNIKQMRDVVKTRMAKRKEMQPLEFPSAGSIFRNPEGSYAGKLIEECQLKGYQVGGAKISEKHANFIINENNATGKDVIDLIKYIQKEVKKKHDIDLILEQIIID